MKKNVSKTPVEKSQLIDGQLFHEMISIFVEEELKNNKFFSIKDIVDVIADYRQVSNHYIYKCLISYKSKFRYGNAIMGYIDGKPVKRSTLIYKAERVLDKIRSDKNISKYMVK